jgi:hypothetical protein
MAHFGRAIHYAQAAHAFGVSKRAREADAREADAREADLGDIIVGRWEDGAEVWTALYSERLAAATRRKRMQQVLRGHGGTERKHSSSQAAKGRRGRSGSVYGEIPGLLDALYASERRGTKSTVHRDTAGTWSIYRCGMTGLMCLVPAKLATEAEGVMRIVKRVEHNLALYDDYTRPLKDGLLIVQDQRRGCVQVKRGSTWGPATELEIFAYYDFLLRYPDLIRNYQSEKKASEIPASDEPLDSPDTVESIWTTIPREYTTPKNESLQLTVKRDRGGIYIGNFGPGTTMSQISDVAWRATFDDNTWPSDIVDSGPGERGPLYDD